MLLLLFRLLGKRSASQTRFQEDYRATGEQRMLIVYSNAAGIVSSAAGAVEKGDC